MYFKSFLDCEKDKSPSSGESFYRDVKTSNAIILLATCLPIHINTNSFKVFHQSLHTILRNNNYSKTQVK